MERYFKLKLVVIWNIFCQRFGLWLKWSMKCLFNYFAICYRLMMIGECCCLISTSLRMCWLMTKMILSLLEYILSFICILYISHCILDEVVLKWLKWFISCSSFALAHRVRVCVHVFIGVWVCVLGECRSCTVWSKKTTDALCLAAFNSWGGLGSDRQSNQLTKGWGGPGLDGQINQGHGRRHAWT